MEPRTSSSDAGGTALAEALPTNAAVHDLVKVCSSLIGLMERETVALRGMRPAEIDSLQERKVELALSYQERVQGLAADPACFKAVEPVLREELKSAMLSLAKAAEENERALRSASAANERTIQAVIDAIASKRTESAAYGPNGSRARGTDAQSPLCVSFDRQL